MAASRVPRVVGDLTPEWLEFALRPSGVLEGHRVRSVTATPFAVGVGLMSQIARIEVTYDGPAAVELPRSFVVKLAATSGTNRAMAVEYGLYAREVRFYRELAMTAGIPTPHAFVAEHDEGSGDMVLVLEDLATAGDAPQGLTITDDEVRSLIRALATFHATWWSGAGRPPPGWVPTLDGPVWAGHQAMFGPAWEVFGRTAEAAARPGFVSFGATLVEHIPALQRRLATAPTTLVHFDMRLSNVIFSRSEERPSLLRVVDWQPFTVARGPYDVALFLSQSIPSDQRRALESEVLTAYHEELVAAGVRHYSHDDVWEDYRLAVAYTSNYAVGTMLVDLGNDTGRQFATQMVDRAAAAIADLDVEAAVLRAVSSPGGQRRGRRDGLG